MSMLKKLLFHSWICTEGNVTENAEIDEWIQKLNETTNVEIHKIPLKQSDFWYYDEADGCIRNKNGSFFVIKGIQRKGKDQILSEQPVILQNEIGYLGILCKEIDGVLNFLMQAKIEPGNLNQIQLSPTIQATKSNFTQKHGGKKPKYLDYFINAYQHTIVVDQIQSEQSSRFYKKRNRNIIVMVDEDVPLEKNFKWMTLGQIKRLMRKDNIVNMDTRTVLSCIPYYNHELSEEELLEMEQQVNDKALFRSVFKANDQTIIPRIFQSINNIKMFEDVSDEIVPLSALSSWHEVNNEIVCRREHDFKVIFCDIMIEGREVTQWTQPLFEATGIALFGLFTCIDQGIRKFFVKVKKEIGCFDLVELGPSVQLEPSLMNVEHDEVTALLVTKLKQQDRVLHDVLLSEEGGRFYHEQNRNVIIEINKNELAAKEENGCFWVDYKTLNTLIQVNNVLNIQLRNLLSLLEA